MNASLEYRLYDSAIADFAHCQPSWWSASAPGHDRYRNRTIADTTVDCAVIGGGYCGLSAAHRLASRHGLGTVVLEAGCEIGWGASGLNGGFVSTGGTMLDVTRMAKRYGEDETVRYWRAQGEAVTELAAFIAGNGIDCDVTGEGNLCVAHSARAAAGLADEIAHARKLGLDLAFIDADTFRAEIHDGPETFGAIRSRPAFGVHPLKLVLGMADAAARAGATIATASQVVGWTREGGRHVLAMRGGGRVRASRVVVATNGYTPNGLSRALDSRIVPAISSIVVSQPYSATELDARGFRSQTPIYNSRELLFYYRRLPGGRILFGERGDRSGTLQAAGERSLIALADLHRVLPAFADARIAYAWRGLVCLTARRVMAVGLDPDDQTTAFAFGCHGSGVATMSGAGRLAADLVAGEVREADVPAPARGLPPRLPGSDLCLRWGLGAAYRWAAWQDGG